MTQVVRKNLPALPVKNNVLFPELLMPMVISRPFTIAAVEAALGREDKLIAVFTQRDADIDEAMSGDIYTVGTLAVIKKMIPIDRMLHIVVQGIQRIELVEANRQRPYIDVSIRLLPDPTAAAGTEIEALHRAVVDLAGRMIELVQPQVQMNLNYVIAEVEQPLHQAYLLASLLSLDVDKEMALLRADTQIELYRLLFNYMNHEVQVLELRDKIAGQVESELGRQQREYVLRQQMRAIQEELGEQRPEQADVIELRKRMEKTPLPEGVRKEVERELNRLERMSSAAPDYQITRSYIELVIELPWYTTTEDVLDLPHAKSILDEDHFDLKDVKERIIEHLAVMKLNPAANAPILCFVGPPGVGKTSVGQSIARAMGRKFERMSLGGMHDEAELRGHRRTYIGAMPGRIIQAIRRAGVNNPLLMLDEVDKLGRDFRGDPAAALMEVLDPAQNFAFHDNYLDMPFDLSKVFFITTANTLDSVPKPLLDRMEVLRLAGYSDEEKREIARRYLISRQISQAGLPPEQLDIPDDTLNYIIRRYTREAGVRELERALGRIARKIATRVAQGDATRITATRERLFEWLGAEHFFEEEARKTLPPGVAAGLAWTEAGGEVLYIEAALLNQGKELTLTGQLGTVMQESAKAAQSYIWAHSDELGIDKARVRNSGLHIHVPAGAVPKDGPSAGVSMVTALTSLYAKIPARSDTAMTGEITLSGLVLPVGGIKEKVLAAHRSGIRRVIIPRENEKDLAELPDHVRESMQFIQARYIEDVLKAAIPGLPSPRNSMRQARA